MQLPYKGNPTDCKILARCFIWTKLNAMKRSKRNIYLAFYSPLHCLCMSTEPRFKLLLWATDSDCYYTDNIIDITSVCRAITTVGLGRAVVPAYSCACPDRETTMSFVGRESLLLNQNVLSPRF